MCENDEKLTFISRRRKYSKCIKNKKKIKLLELPVPRFHKLPLLILIYLSQKRCAMYNADMLKLAKPYFSKTTQITLSSPIYIYMCEFYQPIHISSLCFFPMFIKTLI